MTISSSVSKITYEGDGATLVFTVPFRFVRSADLVVVRTAADSAQTVLSEGTDYAVAGAGGASGGAVTLTAAPTPEERLTINRDPALVQETAYTENDPFPAKVHEAALDLLTMIAQSNRERIERALLLPLSWDGATPSVPAPVADAALVWDDGGDLTNGPTVTEIENAATNAAMAASAATAAATARDASQAAQSAAEAARDEAVAVAGGEHNSLVARDSEDCHPLDAITGLTDALAGKAAVSHTHTLANITDAGSAAGYDVGTGAGQLPTNADIAILPVGASIIWDGDAPPDGFLERDGAVISRTAYAALFAVLGTRFGAGDGSTTFNLPDNRGEFLRGWDHGRGVDPDSTTRTDRGDGTIGDANGTRQNDALRSHTHEINDWISGGTAREMTESGFGKISAKQTSAYGGAETRPRNVSVMYCIKY